MWQYFAHMASLPPRNIVIRNFVFVIKIFVGLGLVALVWHQLDRQAFLEVLKDISLPSFFLALVVFNMSMFCNAVRMRFYLGLAGAKIGVRDAMRIYYINLSFSRAFLGPLGGDGYRTVVFRKRFGLPYQSIIRTLLSERVSGLFTLIIAVFAFAGFTELGHALLLIGFAVLALGYRVFSQVFLKESWEMFTIGLALALVSRVFWLAAVLMLLRRFPEITGLVPSLLAFSASTVAMLVPASFLGVGPRELALVYLAPLLALDVEMMVALSLLVAVMAIISALPGVILFLRGERLPQKHE